VDFISGETVTTTPTDNSGAFAARFWIAGTRMEPEGNQNLSIAYAISEVRGFDSDGHLLDAQDSGSEGGAQTMLLDDITEHVLIAGRRANARRRSPMAPSVWAR